MMDVDLDVPCRPSAEQLARLGSVSTLGEPRYAL